MAHIPPHPGEADRPTPARAYRWIVLLAMSVAVYGSYYAFDYIGPLAPVLSRQLQFSDSAIGLLQAVYSLPNLVAMLVAGVVIDRIGTRRSMAIFSVLVFVGLAVTALSPRLGIMASGRLIVGSGAEALALASNVAVARWFWHDELSLGFGLRSSFMRLGSFTAQVSPTWAAPAYAYWQWPLLIGVGFGGFCLIGAALYWVLDARGERRFALGHVAAEGRFSVGEVFRFNRSFWLIAALCVTFYGCIFPFQTFGQKFLIESRGLSPQTASLLVGMGNIPGGSILQEWMNGHPGVAARWHNWWNAPRTAAAVQAIDPEGSHASWMENFPWTRLAGVEVPDGRKPMIDVARMRLLDAAGVRAYLGDGNFGGPYRKPDARMLELWRVGVEETREALEGPWA
jgi:MFS family permease